MNNKVVRKQKLEKKIPTTILTQSVQTEQKRENALLDLDQICSRPVCSPEVQKKNTTLVWFNVSQRFYTKNKNTSHLIEKRGDNMSV